MHAVTHCAHTFCSKSYSISFEQRETYENCISMPLASCVRIVNDVDFCLREFLSRLHNTEITKYL